AVCWGAFALAWTAGAIYNFFRAPATRRRSGIDGVWIAGLALAALALRVIPAGFWAPLRLDTAWLRAIGAALLLAATAFPLWARWVLGTMWSSYATAREGHELRTDGPYALVRHPIYTGLLGMLVGSALLGGLGVWLAGLLIAVVLVEVKIAAEE